MKKKFTMVELLVVISVIMILAGLLLPALSKAKNMAKQTYCSGNQKSIGLGMASYRNDYNGYMLDDNDWGNWAWFSQLGPANLYDGLGYVENIAVYKCPANEEFYNYHKGTSNAMYKYKDCYAINSDITLASDVRILQPTKAVVILEGYAEDYSPPMTPMGFYPGYPSRLNTAVIPNSGSCRIGFFHGGKNRCNVLFFDNHVHTSPRGDFPDSTSAPLSSPVFEWQDWNNDHK